MEFWIQFGTISAWEPFLVCRGSWFTFTKQIMVTCCLVCARAAGVRDGQRNMMIVIWASDTYLVVQKKREKTIRVQYDEYWCLDAAKICIETRDFLDSPANLKYRSSGNRVRDIRDCWDPRFYFVIQSVTLNVCEAFFQNNKVDLQLFRFNVIVHKNLREMNSRFQSLEFPGKLLTLDTAHVCLLRAYAKWTISQFSIKTCTLINDRFSANFAYKPFFPVNRWTTILLCVFYGTSWARRGCSYITAFSF